MKLVCHYFAIFSRPVLCLFPPSGHCSMPFPINPGRFSENYRPLTQNSKYEETSLQKNNKKNMKAASSKQIPSWFQNSNNQQLKQNNADSNPQLQRDFHGSTYFWQGIFATHDYHPNQDAIFFRNSKGHQDFGHLFLVGKKLRGVNWSQWVNPTKV